jgi:GNAT superfamily N-acetyltransferase
MKPPESAIVVREARQEDIQTIVEYNCAMAIESEDQILDPKQVDLGVQAVLQDHSKGFYLMASRQDRVVGQLMITYEWSDWRCANFWWIQSVYVLPSERRSGVFSKLFTHLVTLAKGRSDVCGLRLYTSKSNLTAKITYKKLGFFFARYDLFEKNIGNTVGEM